MTLFMCCQWRLWLILLSIVTCAFLYLSIFSTYILSYTMPSFLPTSFLSHIFLFHFLSTSAPLRSGSLEGSLLCVLSRDLDLNFGKTRLDLFRSVIC